MPLKQNKLNDQDLDRMFQVLLEGLKENAGLDVKKKIVNSILPVHKYKVLDRFLSDRWLNERDRLNCLSIFLDENTKYFNFVQSSANHSTIKNIFEIIPRYCPNIETIDFRGLWMLLCNKENFKTFLKQTKSLKYLRVDCLRNYYAIYQLLLKDDFDLHDKDIQNGLLKIDYIHAMRLSDSECAKLFNLLPNLKGLGMHQQLVPLVSTISDDDDLVKKLFKLTEFYDIRTGFSTLQRLIKFCPNANKIRLWMPQRNVIRNLRKFPLLTEIHIYSENLYAFGEIINLLEEIGKQIKILFLIIPVQWGLDRNIIYELCPELIKLHISPAN